MVHDESSSNQMIRILSMYLGWPALLKNVYQEFCTKKGSYDKSSDFFWKLWAGYHSSSRISSILIRNLMASCFDYFRKCYAIINILQMTLGTLTCVRCNGVAIFQVNCTVIRQFPVYWPHETAQTHWKIYWIIWDAVTKFSNLVRVVGWKPESEMSLSILNKSMNHEYTVQSFSGHIKRPCCPVCISPWSHNQDPYGVHVHCPSSCLYMQNCIWY